MALEERMPQVSTQEFEGLPLRVHTFLAGVPLHDVWFIDLPRWRAGVTLDEFLRTADNCKLDTCGCSKSSSLFTPSRIVRKLIVYPSLLRSVRARWNQAFGSN